MKKYMAIAGLILVTVIWGGGFVASDMALDSLLPFQIMAIRFLLASVLMGGISIRSLKGVKREELKAGALMGTALFLGFSLQIIGLQYTTVKECVSDCDECGDRTVYRVFDLQKEGGAEGDSRRSAGNCGGWSSVPG